ncbi:MAG: endo alpha-1,4 polygalactosaminidase [Hyphomicrobiaceae bacterium]|nr:endo alpha-1,4 polygalactosaminidase [Hyphomicrobiaceae bacterium]
MPTACWPTCLSLVSLLGLITILGSEGAFAQPLERAGRLAAVRSWGYQLQSPSIERLALSPHDLLVIDFSRDGSNEGAFSADEIRRIREGSGGSGRIVLAYLSIGEAESYRGYWRWYWGGQWYSRALGWVFGPPWLGPENRAWRGNFAVRYWQEGWQRRILGPGGLLDLILDAGFDGVYLDKIDSSIEPIARDRASARDDMREFVRRIAEKARSKRPGFVVVPQNGEELLTDDAYIELIDGIGKEDLLYGEIDEGKPNPESVIARRTELLLRAVARGRTVLAVEYLDDGAAIESSRQRLEGLGFVPYFADRPLQTLRYGDLPSTAGEFRR